MKEIFPSQKHHQKTPKPKPKQPKNPTKTTSTSRGKEKEKENCVKLRTKAFYYQRRWTSSEVIITQEIYSAQQCFSWQCQCLC